MAKVFSENACFLQIFEELRPFWIDQLRYPSENIKVESFKDFSFQLWKRPPKFIVCKPPKWIAFEINFANDFKKQNQSLYEWYSYYTPPMINKG